MRDLAKAFSEMTHKSEDQIDLAQAALLMARMEYPRLDQARYLAILSGMADRLKPGLAGVHHPEEAVRELNRLLFEIEGYRGNTSNYFDPRNSFLNQVLERKLGNPISLSLVYILVGQRAGLKVEGVGLPGHFISALTMNQQRLLVDVFHQGRILTREDCRRLVLDRYGEAFPFGDDLLQPMGPKKILIRMLRNLKGIYKLMDSQLKHFQTVQWILELDSRAALEHRERGLIYEDLGDPRRAVLDLRRYLDLSPEAEDRDRIKESIERLSGKTPQVH